MGHTPPPLRIGVDGHGNGYALPSGDFEREIGEDVEVRVETACSVRFDPNPFFDDEDYPRPVTTTWRPKDRQDNGTPKFHVYPYQRGILNTHSIKIGSGLLRKRAKAKSKKAKAKKTAAKRAKARRQKK
jgi:hypothetical protein